VAAAGHFGASSSVDRPNVGYYEASHLREVLVADHPAYRARPEFYDLRGAARTHASIRASDADRERLVEVLKTGFAEGRLTQDEYNFRMDRAYRARTYGELGLLVSDLPAPQPAYGYPAYRQPGTNSMAVASLVFGIAEFFTGGLTAIPAVILGHMARRQMQVTGESGRGMAKAGLVLGWTAIALFVLTVVLAVVGGLVLAHGGHTQISTPQGPQLLPLIRQGVPGQGG
jgi:hypothetical protein